MIEGLLVYVALGAMAAIADVHFEVKLSPAIWWMWGSIAGIVFMAIAQVR